MALPRRVAETLEAVGGLPAALLSMSGEQVCEGARHHSPTPLLVTHIDLAEEFGSTTQAKAWLCGTCHDNLRVYQHLLEAHEGVLDWGVRREFGNLIRALGDDGWRAHLEARRG